MPLHPNSQLLVDRLENLPVLDGRFTGMKLINFDSVADQKRGSFSLVFKATEMATGEPVALKFYDLDPNWFHDAYRTAAFRREHEILSGLQGRDHCLQLLSGFDVFHLDVPVVPGTNITLPCPYFAIEWIADEIDPYFLQQDTFAALDKLRLLDGVIHSVEILHRHGIFHRDLKPDNLRACKRNGRRIIIPIDMGTAARMTSNPIATVYGRPAGAPAYASPEARCGLAGNRRLAQATDVYAIGCMLYELFNPDFFVRALLDRNPVIGVVLAAMQTYVNATHDDHAQQVEWDVALAKHGNSVVAVPLDGPGNTVPPGVMPVLSDLLQTLTSVDYKNRPTDLAHVRRRLLGPMRALQNEASYQVRLARARALRQAKIKRAVEREERVRQALKARRNGDD